MQPIDATNPVPFPPHIQPTFLFFDALFGDHLRNHSSYIALSWHAPGDKKFHNEYSEDIFLASSRAADYRESKVNGFFAVAPRVRPNRGKKSIRAVLTLHVDADGSDRSIERKIKQLKPSALIHSGSRYSFHPYFFLEVPVAVPENTKVIEEANKHLALQMGITYTSTCDTSRLLRIPGTLNCKNPDRPSPVELVDFQPSQRYQIEYFVEMFGIQINSTSYEDLSPSSNEERGRGWFLSSAEMDYVEALLKNGLFEPHSRNHAMLLLIRYWYGEGLSKGETTSSVINFFIGRHNNMSRDWFCNPEHCKSQINYAVNNWWQKAYPRRTIQISEATLSALDKKYIDGIPLNRRDKEFLEDALVFIANHKRDDQLVLSKRQLMQFRNVHSRNYKAKRTLLNRLGIIEEAKRANIGRRLAAEYKVTYKPVQPDSPRRVSKQASPIAIESLSDSIDAFLLLGISTSEIATRLPGASKQRIWYRRQRLEKMAARDQFLNE